MCSWHIQALPIIFPLHLDGVVLNHTRIWWVSNLHENSRAQNMICSLLTSSISPNGKVSVHDIVPSISKPNVFLQICTHTHTIPIDNDLCPPMLFKLCPCIQKLCNVCYPPTPSLGWIGQIKGRSLSLASA